MVLPLVGYTTGMMLLFKRGPSIPSHEIILAKAASVTIFPNRKHASKDHTNHMITHRNKKIKEQFPSLLHLHLHRAAPLKSRPAPNNKRKVMRPQLGLVVRCIRVCVARTREDRAALDPSMQALL